MGGFFALLVAELETSFENPALELKGIYHEALEEHEGMEQWLCRPQRAGMKDFVLTTDEGNIPTAMAVGWRWREPVPGSGLFGKATLQAGLQDRLTKQTRSASRSALPLLLTDQRKSLLGLSDQCQ